MTTVTQVPFPPESRLQPMLAGAHYVDAFAAPLADPALTPVEIMGRVGEAFPDWAEALLAVRNQVVKRLGVRDVGAFRKPGQPRPGRAQVGDPMGIFTVVSVGEIELVLGIDDTHLDVRVSVLKRGEEASARYVLGSVVTIHNALGRLYMIPVAPFHRMIVRTMMRAAGV